MPYASSRAFIITRPARRGLIVSSPTISTNSSVDKSAKSFNDLIPASVALQKAKEFLETSGDWLNERPVALLLQALRKGLIFEATVGYRKNGQDRYSRQELDEAVSREKEKRATLRAVMQKALQQRNREINSRRRQASSKDANFMNEALEFAREAAINGEVPVGCVVVKDKIPCDEDGDKFGSRARYHPRKALFRR